MTWLRDHIVDQTIPVEQAFRHNLETDKVCTFLKDIRGGRKHRAWQNSADICMMTERCGEKDDFIRLRVEHRTDNGYVREMPASSPSILTTRAVYGDDESTYNPPAYEEFVINTPGSSVLPRSSIPSELGLEAKLNFRQERFLLCSSEIPLCDRTISLRGVL